MFLYLAPSNRRLGKTQLEKVTYIRVGLGRSHESPALMHTSLTRWTAKSFRLHRRRIVTIISRGFSNSDVGERQ